LLNLILLPKHRQKDKSIKKPLFLYNFTDVNTLQLSVNNDDFKNDKYKNIKQLFRCGLPFSKFNEVPALNGGVVNNCVSTYVLNHYLPKKATIISLSDFYLYEKYSPKSLLQIALSYIFMSADVSELNSINFSSDLLNPDNTTLITISNQLRPSKNKYHKGLFIDWTKQKFFFETYFPLSYEKLLVLQNEGYLQTHYALKDNSKIQIPNPSVYKSAFQFIRRPLTKFF